jgi:hypothetical protein
MIGRARRLDARRHRHHAQRNNPAHHFRVILFLRERPRWKDAGVAPLIPLSDGTKYLLLPKYGQE